MHLEQALERVKQLTEAVSQSLANHNALLGALSEANTWVQRLETAEKDVEGAVNAIEPPQS